MILEVAPTFKPGDLPPTNGSYLDWHEWAEVQEKAGVKQQKCAECGLWNTPQELSGRTMKWEVYRTKADCIAKRNPIPQSGPICSDCAAKQDARKADIAATNLKTRPAAPQPPPAPGSRSGDSNAPTGSLDAPMGVVCGGREGAK